MSPFFGFGNLNKFFDPSANSIRHAGYIQVERRFAQGLGFTVNYTYGKSIDDASDSSPDVRVLTTGSTLGQVYYGAPRSGDRAISSFDIKHNVTSTFLWDLPFGSKRWLFSKAPKVVDGIIGGWTMSGVVRFQGGQPFTPFITDTNRLGGVNRSVRMNHRSRCAAQEPAVLKQLLDRSRLRALHQSGGFHASAQRFAGKLTTHTGYTIANAAVFRRLDPEEL